MVGIAAEGAREADLALEGRRVDTDAANDSRFGIELVQKRIKLPKLIESSRLGQRYVSVPEVGVAAEVRGEAHVVCHERGVDGGEAGFLPGDAVVACWSTSFVQSVRQPVGLSSSQSVSQSVSRSVGQPVIRSVGRSVSHPSLPVNPFLHQRS